MEQEPISSKVFMAGFVLGIFLAILPFTQNYLEVVTKLFYSNEINLLLFVLLWGVIVGGFLFGNYAVYLKEKSLGLVKLWAVLGFLILAMFLFVSGGLGSVSEVF